MKHFYYFLILIFINSFNSQVQSQDFTPQVDYYFQHLDKSQVPTGILYERVFPAADVGRFTNTTIDTTSALHFFNSFGELQTADYTGRWQPASTIIDDLASKPHWEVPVGVINIDYNTIDELSFQDNLLDFTVFQGDTLLVDVPNRPRLPYLSHTAILASPLKMQTNSLSPGFYWEVTRQAGQNNITQVEVNFNLGNGWQNLNSVITPTFPNYGVFYIDFKITLSNNVTRINRARFEIISETIATTINQKIQDFSTGDCLDNQGEFYASRSFQGYDETQAYFGKGEYAIRQGGTLIDKLIVVVDGFDPMEGTDSGKDLNGIFADFNQQTLGNNLQFNNDFDILALNFKKQVFFNSGNFLFPTVINGGSDYIERNAMVLVTLLEKLNSCKTGNHPIKVVGFSMGGVVARYALRYMEEQNIDHNVDLFVSIDSPHQGAVVPKGIQDVADLVNDLTLGIFNGPLDLLESPAAKQLLKHHISSNSVSPAGAPNFHNRIFTELNQMGYPQNSRNISVINGTLDGTQTNGFGQQYVNANGRAILGILKADMKLNYSPIPGNTINDLYSRIYLRFPLLKITIFKRERSVSSISSLGSLENSPGGYYDVDNLTDKFFEGGFNNVFGNTNGSTLQHFIRDVFLNVNVTVTDPNFSFIPTKSGLDFIGDPYLYENLNARDFTCTGETPFDTYFAPEVNQKHIFIGSQAANFIKDEINGIQREPPVDSSLDNLSGPEFICGQSTYSFDACSGSISSWSVSSNLIIENSTEYSLTVRPQYSTSSGQGYITATSASGSIVTKEVYVGIPNSVSKLSHVSFGCTMGEIFAKPALGAEQYEWEVSGAVITDNGGTSYINGSSIFVDPHDNLSSFTVKVRSINSCGTSDWYTKTIPMDCSGGPTPLSTSPEVNNDASETIVAYPNPANDQITVIVREDFENSESRPTEIHAIRVLDQNSMERQYFTFKQNRTVQTIDISYLTPGLNFLLIYTDTGVITKKILVR